MAKYDELWIVKDKYGQFWLGTLGATKDDTLSNLACLDDPKLQTEYETKVVKVKLVEVK